MSAVTFTTKHVYAGSDESLHGETTLAIPGLAADDIFGNVYVLRQVSQLILFFCYCLYVLILCIYLFLF